MSLPKLVKTGLIFGLLAFFFSLFFSIVVGEYIVKHLLPQNTYQMARMVGLHFFQAGENIPFTFQKNVKNFHHIGYTHEFDHLVSTNSWGTRGKEFSQTKDPKTMRILFLGDSMTFGWGVNDDQNYPYLVETNLNDEAKQLKTDKKFESINAGFTDGLTLDSYYVYLKENIASFNPDLVVVDLFPYNDLSDMTEMRWVKTDAKGYPTQIISDRQKVAVGYLESRVKTNWMFEIPVLRNSHLAILIFNAMERGSPQTVDKIKQDLGVTSEKEAFTLNERLNCIYSFVPDMCHPDLLASAKKIDFLLLGLHDLVKENNKKFMVTIMASPDQAIKLASSGDREKTVSEAQPQKYYREFLAKNNILYLDLLPVLSSGKPQEYFFGRDGHLNVNGHRLVAQTLASFISKNY